MAMAMRDSVTVSMAAETMGILRMVDCGSYKGFEEVNKKFNDTEKSENKMTENTKNINKSMGLLATSSVIVAVGVILSKIIGYIYRNSAFLVLLSNYFLEKC